jgi:uncharacterized protein YjbI with pentapeptide repeats
MIYTFNRCAPVGQPWCARVDGAPSETIGRRAAIEHAARTGEALHYLSLDGMDLSGGHFDGLKLVNCSAVGVNWSNARLAGATFERCNLTSGLFERVKAPGASFITCNLFGSIWKDADATEAAFTACNFRNVAARGIKAPRSRWDSVRTSRADFTGADLSYADLGGLEGRESILAQCAMPEHIKAGTRSRSVGSSMENAIKFAERCKAEAQA